MSPNSRSNPNECLMLSNPNELEVRSNGFISSLYFVYSLTEGMDGTLVSHVFPSLIKMLGEFPLAVASQWWFLEVLSPWDSGLLSLVDYLISGGGSPSLVAAGLLMAVATAGGRHR